MGTTVQTNLARALSFFKLYPLAFVASSPWVVEEHGSGQDSLGMKSQPAPESDSLDRAMNIEFGHDITDVGAHRLW